MQYGFHAGSQGVLMAELQYMLGKEVVVIANGVQYSGVLIEVSDTEVHLKGVMQWITLPASSVSTIKLASVAESSRGWSGEGLQ